MKKDAEAALLRRDLDAVLRKWRGIPVAPPKRGWIRDVREALGMTASDLARRMGMTQPAVAAMEQSEIKGTLQLSTLRRAAVGMECVLVYAIVPKRSLEHIVDRRRKNIAYKELSVALAGKIGRDYRELLAAYALKIRRSRWWREE